MQRALDPENGVIELARYHRSRNPRLTHRLVTFLRSLEAVPDAIPAKYLALSGVQSRMTWIKEWSAAYAAKERGRADTAGAHRKP